MSQICPCCAPGGRGLLAVIVALITGGVMISAYIGDIVLTAGIIVTVLVIVSSFTLAYVLRRGHEHVSTREAIGESVAALAEPPRKSLPSARKAITGAYVITDATEVREPARMAIKRDGTVTG